MALSGNFPACDSLDESTPSRLQEETTQTSLLLLLPLLLLLQRESLLGMRKLGIQFASV